MRESGFSTSTTKPWLLQAFLDYLYIVAEAPLMEVLRFRRHNVVPNVILIWEGGLGEGESSWVTNQYHLLAKARDDERYLCN